MLRNLQQANSGSDGGSDGAAPLWAGFGPSADAAAAAGVQAPSLNGNALVHGPPEDDGTSNLDGFFAQVAGVKVRGHTSMCRFG